MEWNFGENNSSTEFWEEAAQDPTDSQKESVCHSDNDKYTIFC